MEHNPLPPPFYPPSINDFILFFDSVNPSVWTALQHDSEQKCVYYY